MITWSIIKRVQSDGNGIGLIFAQIHFDSFPLCIAFIEFAIDRTDLTIALITPRTPLTTIHGHAALALIPGCGNKSQQWSLVTSNIISNICYLYRWCIIILISMLYRISIAALILNNGRTECYRMITLVESKFFIAIFNVSPVFMFVIIDLSITRFRQLTLYPPRYPFSIIGFSSIIKIKVSYILILFRRRNDCSLLGLTDRRHVVRDGQRQIGRIRRRRVIVAVRYRHLHADALQVQLIISSSLIVPQGAMAGHCQGHLAGVFSHGYGEDVRPAGRPLEDTTLQLQRYIIFLAIHDGFEAGIRIFSIRELIFRGAALCIRSELDIEQRGCVKRLERCFRRLGQLQRGRNIPVHRHHRRVVFDGYSNGRRSALISASIHYLNSEGFGIFCQLVRPILGQMVIVLRLGIGIDDCSRRLVVLQSQLTICCWNGQPLILEKLTASIQRELVFLPVDGQDQLPFLAIGIHAHSPAGFGAIRLAVTAFRRLCTTAQDIYIGLVRDQCRLGYRKIRKVFQGNVHRLCCRIIITVHGDEAQLKVPQLAVLTLDQELLILLHFPGPAVAILFQRGREQFVTVYRCRQPGVAQVINYDGDNGRLRSVVTIKNRKRVCTVGLKSEHLLHGELHIRHGKVLGITVGP